jgi:hypothetical protein
MTTSPSTGGGRKALAIITLVLSGLALFSCLSEVGGAVYTLSTGKVVGRDLAHQIMQAGPNAKDPKLDEILDQQAEGQKKLAPLQLATVLPYALCVATIGFAAIQWLRRRPAGAWLLPVALLTCGIRLAYGYVQYRVTETATATFQSSFERGMENGARANLRSGDRAKLDPQMREVGSIVTTVTRAATYFTVLGQGLMMVVFWAVAGAMLRKPKETPAVTSP